MDYYQIKTVIIPIDFTISSHHFNRVPMVLSSTVYTCVYVCIYVCLLKPNNETNNVAKHTYIARFLDDK